MGYNKVEPGDAMEVPVHGGELCRTLKERGYIIHDVPFGMPSRSTWLYVTTESNVTQLTECGALCLAFLTSDEDKQRSFGVPNHLGCRVLRHRSM